MSEIVKQRSVRAVPDIVKVERLAAVILLAGALSVPFLLKGFMVFQLTQMMIYAIAILGLNFLTGINGQFSLGHGAFYAAGAYAAAIAIQFGGIPYPLAIILAGAFCFAFGFLVGFPALRLEGIYLALATFALAVAMPQLLKLSPFEPWTGGVMGMVLTTPEAPFGLPLTSDQWLYFVTIAYGLAIYWLLRNLIGSRNGRALMAIRDNPVAASAMGVNLAMFKTLAFGVSAATTGVAGALSAIVVQFVAPDSFTFFLSIALMVGMVVGGVAWLPGALFGGAFIMFVPNLADEISQGLAGVLYGVFLILTIYLFPNGLGGLITRLGKKFTNH